MSIVVDEELERALDEHLCNYMAICLIECAVNGTPPPWGRHPPIPMQEFLSWLNRTQ